jgi:hypothetical protein
MESEPNMEMIQSPVVPNNTDTKNFDVQSEGVSSVVQDEPAKLKSALRKFDIFFVPVTLIFQVLSALDNNNVSETNSSYASQIMSNN